MSALHVFGTTTLATILLRQLRASAIPAFSSFLVQGTPPLVSERLSVQFAWRLCTFLSPAPSLLFRNLRCEIVRNPQACWRDASLARYSVFLEICLSSREFCLVCCTAVHVLASLVHILLLAIALSTTLSDMSDIYFIRVSLSGCAVLTSINALGLPSRTCINGSI